MKAWVAGSAAAVNTIVCRAWLNWRSLPRLSTTAGYSGSGAFDVLLAPNANPTKRAAMVQAGLARCVGFRRPAHRIGEVPGNFLLRGVPRGHTPGNHLRRCDLGPFGPGQAKPNRDTAAPAIVSSAIRTAVSLPPRAAMGAIAAAATHCTKAEDRRAGAGVLGHPHGASTPASATIKPWTVSVDGPQNPRGREPRITTKTKPPAKAACAAFTSESTASHHLLQ
jgi:hypothetical protein